MCLLSLFKKYICKRKLREELKKEVNQENIDQSKQIGSLGNTFQCNFPRNCTTSSHWLQSKHIESIYSQLFNVFLLTSFEFSI